MAKFNHNRLIGPISGKIGGVVFSSWKGIPYMKAANPTRTKHISDKEKGNRIKFAMAQQWLRPLLDLVRVGFKGYTPTVEGFAAAKYYLMKNAMQGSGAESTINPALVKVSFGNLSLSENIAVQLTDNKELQLTWDTAYPAEGSPLDQVMLLAYDIENKEADFYTAGEFRYKGADQMQLNAPKGTTWHIYVAFVAEDRSRQSDSVYLGTITL
jgi:hypothetical protein